MQYDPIKFTLGRVFNATPGLRVLFYRMLNMLLLRAWHINKALKQLRLSGGGKQSILDAGSGFGQYSFRMTRIFPDSAILGVDVKAEQMADCNAFFKRIGKHGVTFEVADLTTFVRNRSFDLVLSVDVMEHIEDDLQVFRNFYASLKDGGVLLISTPSDQGGSDAHGHDHGTDGMHGFIDEHVRDGYGIADITEKLTAAGFDHIEAWYTYGTPGHISWLLSMKYPILLLNASKWFFVLLPVYYTITFPFACLLNYLDLWGRHKAGTGLMVKASKKKEPFNRI